MVVCVVDYFSHVRVCYIRRLLVLQVIEIVRKNVRVLCESLLTVARGRPSLLDAGLAPQSVDDLKLYRMLQRVFSRMLWNGGRGLMDCLAVDQRYLPRHNFWFTAK